MYHHAAPIPDPFIWNPEFDVQHPDINREHDVIMKNVNILAADFYSLDNIDELYRSLYDHFLHEEEIMAGLLLRLRDVMDHNRLSAVNYGQGGSSSSFASEKSIDSAGENDNTDHIPVGYDPIFEAEITIWTGVQAGEVIKVDLRDYVLTEDVYSSHKAKHAVLLEDALIVRRRAERAIKRQKEGLPPNVDPWDYDPLGTREISFITNWYTQHVKTEDMSIKHTILLCERLEAQERVAREMNERAILRRSITVKSSISSDTTNWDDLSNEKGVGQLSPQSTFTKPSISIMRQLGARLTKEEIIGARTCNVSNMLLARAWMASIQLNTVCGIALIRPPSIKRSRAFRLVVGSATWGLLTGYNPWMASGVDIIPFLSGDQSVEVIGLLRKLVLLNTAEGTDFEARENTSLICLVHIVPREGQSIPSLMVVLPVKVEAPYFESHKLTLAAFFFVFENLTHFQRHSLTPGLQSRSHLIQFAALQQRPFMEKSLLSDLSRDKKPPSLFYTWKHFPSQHELFLGVLEAFVIGLMKSDFVSQQELPGLKLQLFPCRPLRQARRAKLSALYELIRSNLKQKAPSEESHASSERKSETTASADLKIKSDQARTGSEDYYQGTALSSEISSDHQSGTEGTSDASTLAELVGLETSTPIMMNEMAANKPRKYSVNLQPFSKQKKDPLLSPVVPVSTPVSTPHKRRFRTRSSTSSPHQAKSSLKPRFFGGKGRKRGKLLSIL